MHRSEYHACAAVMAVCVCHCLLPQHAVNLIQLSTHCHIWASAGLLLLFVAALCYSFSGLSKSACSVSRRQTSTLCSDSE